MAPGSAAGVANVRPAPMVMVNAFCAVRFAASVTVTVKLNVPVVVGVPANAPVGASSVSPGGVLPAVTVKTYGGVPPVAASVVVYGDPVTPSGSGLADVMVSAPATAIVKSFVARDELPSTTRAVKLNDPPVVGVPSILPSEWNVSPGGSAPAFTLQI